MKRSPASGASAASLRVPSRSCFGARRRRRARRAREDSSRSRPFGTATVMSSSRTSRPPVAAALTPCPPDAGAERRELLLDALVAAVEVVDAAGPRSSPRRASPASTSDAEARRSVAITGAPESGVDALARPPSRPSTAMSAPMRLQLRHVHEAVLEDGLGDDRRCRRPRHSSAMSCACMSVGKPGCGAVVDVHRARRGRRRRRAGRPAPRVDRGAGLAQLLDERLEVRRARRRCDQHVAAGRSRRPPGRCPPRCGRG